MPPPPPCALPAVVDLSAFNAAAAWKPMGGTAETSVTAFDGRRALRLPCNFKGTSIDRASWDRAVNLDLAACRGIRFDLYCADPKPVAQFIFYLRSGQGWYAGTFGPTRSEGWSPVVLDRNNLRVEGSPDGWGSIDTLRVSAWRGDGADTEFYIANLALDGADAPIAILRGDSAAKSTPGEAESIARYAKTVADALDRLGLPHIVMSDLDATRERLRGRRVVVLPHNPEMPGEAEETLSGFLDDGGKLLAFYILPPKLAGKAGIGGGELVRQSRPGHFACIRPAGEGLPGLPAAVGQASWNIRHSVPVDGRSRMVATWFDDQGASTGEPAILASSNCVFMTHVLLGDDPWNKQAMLLSMLGSLDATLWASALEKVLHRIGTIGPYGGFDEAVRGMRRQARGDARARKAIDDAEELHRGAVRAVREREYARALEAAARAQQSVLLAYCAAQKPRRGEHRAWWCHSAFGVQGLSWDEAVKNLADNGFTDILPNMLWGGAAFYESEVLPVAPSAREKGDQIAACLAACRKYGVKCHVWKVNWNMGWCSPPEFMERMRQEGRTQEGFDGSPEPRWLCPSHPANRQLEIDAMVEVATKYDVDGVHFDYIRYPDAQHCFCAGCRERFEAVLGARVANWPADTRDHPAIRTAWLDFRRDNITRVVAAVHDEVKKRKPAVQVSAAVFSNWPVDRDGVGQDWKLWCERGYLDFVCPMDYTPNDSRFETLVGQQREWAGEVPCYPGIGLSCWGGDPDAAKLIGQIQATRRLGTGGFTVFNYGAAEAGAIVPLCGQGITRKE
jgi:uncharacterized lipoprotein YddW (UPF0748 family)